MNVEELPTVYSLIKSTQGESIDLSNEAVEEVNKYIGEQFAAKGLKFKGFDLATYKLTAFVKDGDVMVEARWPDEQDETAMNVSELSLGKVPENFYA